MKENTYNDELKESNKNLEQAYMESIQTLRFAFEAKDKYFRGHSDRVSEYSLLVGKKLGLSDDDLEILKLGGLFHDIGKMGIPDNILLKPTKLTDDEYAQIKTHPLIGASILSNGTIFKDIIPVVKYHHEKYDGTGYPSKLKGADIPLSARIIAITDTFDAMISKRIYRDALSLDSVKEEFKKCKGTQFDPKLVDIFLDILNNNYNDIVEIQSKYL